MKHRLASSLSALFATIAVFIRLLSLTYGGYHISRSMLEVIFDPGINGLSMNPDVILTVTFGSILIWIGVFSISRVLLSIVGIKM